MDKARYCGDLFQDDQPGINTAFPENEPLDDVGDQVDVATLDSPVSSHDAEGSEKSDFSPNKLSRGQIVNHRYSLRSRGK